VLSKVFQRYFPRDGKKVHYTLLLSYAGTGASFITVFGLGYFMPVDQYGVLVLGQVHFGILCSLGAFGTDIKTTADIAISKDPFWTLRKALLLRLCVTGSVLIVYSVLLLYGVIGGTSHESKLVVMLSLATAITVILSPKPLYDASERTLNHLLQGLIEKALLLLIVGVDLLQTTSPYTASRFALTAIALRLAFFGIEWWCSGVGDHSTQKITPQDVTSLAKESLTFAGASAANTVLVRSSQLLVERQCGLEDLAKYGAAIQLGNALEIGCSTLLRVQTTSVARNIAGAELGEKKVTFSNNVIKYATQLGYLTLASLLVIALLNCLNCLPKMLIDEHWLIFGCLLRTWVLAVGLKLNPYIPILGLGKKYLSATATAAVLSPAISFVLIEYAGVQGAPFAVALVHSISVVLQYSAIYIALVELQTKNR
jgi:O-antigen/teichoic acid export membrane protein